MSLGKRNAQARHQRGIARQAVNSAAYWLFQPGDRVMTVDGLPGVVALVQDGPVAGYEEYHITLDNGLGGGRYTSSQLSALTQQFASVEHTAADDYPELGSILVDRPDPAQEIVSLGSKTAKVYCPLCGFEEGGRNANPGEQCPTCGAGLGGQSEPEVTQQNGSFSCPDCGYSQGARFHPVTECPMCAAHTRTAGAGMGAGASAFDGTHVWVTIPGVSSIKQMDPSTGMIIRTIGTGAPAVSVAFDGANIWITGSDGSMTEINPFNGTMVRRIMASASCPNCNTWNGRQTPGDKCWNCDHQMAHEDEGTNRPQDLMNREPKRVAHLTPYEDHQDLDHKSPDGHCEYCGSGGHSTDEHEDEPQDDDAFISHRNEASMGGKYLGRGEGDEPHAHAHALIHDEMNRQGYYPNIWDEHGNNCGQHHQDMLDAHDRANSEEVLGNEIDDHFDRVVPYRQDDELTHAHETVNDHFNQPHLRPAHDLLADNQIGPTKYSSAHPAPRFRAGDHVIDFRGDPATVHRVHPSDTPGKSHRVQVRWDDPERNLAWDGSEDPEGAGDKTAYYEHVFDHHPDHGEGHNVGDEIDNHFGGGEFDAEREFLHSNPQGPSHYSMLIEATNDSDFRFHITATWADVRNKATRLRKEGRVKVVSASNAYIVAEVKGDHHVYETQLTYVPGTKKIAIWSCGCKWGSYAWGRSGRWKRYEGRVCSHALATSYEAQSRGMFGAEVTPDATRPVWQRAHSPVVVEHDKTKDKNLTRRAVPPGNMKRTFSMVEESALTTLVREAVSQGENPAEIVLAMMAAGIDQPQMRFQAAIYTTHDASPHDVDEPHWEDYESPQCHYCGGTDHTTHEHEVREGWIPANDPNYQPDFMKRSNIEMNEEDPGGGNGAGPESGEDEAEQMGDGTGTGLGGLGNAAASLRDEFLFEAPLRSEAAFLAPLLEALPELAGAGEAAGAGAGEAAEGGSALNGANGLNPLHHLAPHDHNQTADTQAPTIGGDQGSAAIDSDYKTHFSTFHPVPEGALPATDGVDLEAEQAEEDGNPENMNVTPAGSGGGAVASLGSSWQAEVAAAARAHLAKQSMKTFSPAEQAAIINEGEGVKAANLELLQIAGTHYEVLEAALGSQDEDDDFLG